MQYFLVLRKWKEDSDFSPVTNRTTSLCDDVPSHRDFGFIVYIYIGIYIYIYIYIGIYIYMGNQENQNRSEILNSTTQTRVVLAGLGSPPSFTTNS